VRKKERASKRANKRDLATFAFASPPVLFFLLFSSNTKGGLVALVVHADFFLTTLATTSTSQKHSGQALLSAITCPH
jgi:hypothetical protein